MIKVGILNEMGQLGWVPAELMGVSAVMKSALLEIRVRNVFSEYLRNFNRRARSERVSLWLSIPSDEGGAALRVLPDSVEGLR